MSDWVIDASLALQWLLEDEADRAYSLAVLKGLAEHGAIVPLLWFYEVGNGLIMAYRRKRITFEQATGFVKKLAALPIRASEQEPPKILQLVDIANAHRLTNYDAAYLEVAMRLQLPLATNDKDLKRAAADGNVKLVVP